MIEPRFRWIAPRAVPVDAECVTAGAAAGLSARVVALLAARGVSTPDDLRRFLAPPEEGLHDPRLLPDAAATLRRVAEARARQERILVYGDFDADGLTGLAILVLALRSLGLDAAPYAPERLGDGHGLSLRAIERAVAEGRTLIVTADCGTSSEPEIAVAKSRGVDVVVTDHHHAPSWPVSAVAVVNPLRTDGEYPERHLTGAGVAWKVAQLLLDDPGGLPSALVRDLADLALVGTIADVAPVLGENRVIARLGLDKFHSNARPGLAALMRCGGLPADRLAVEDIAFGIAPRLNAAGRVGEAARSARLLLCEDPAEAEALASEIEAANKERRALTKSCLDAARIALGLEAPARRPEEEEAGPAADGGAADGLFEEEAPGPAEDLPDAQLPPALLVRGDWPLGIIGLVAGRLAEDHGRPAVVVAPIDEDATILRGSCRGPSEWSLAEAVGRCADLLLRHGGHAAAAGFDIPAERWPEFQSRFLELAAGAPAPSVRRELELDMVLPAEQVDYALLRELSRLEPAGPGNPAATICLTGLTVARARLANGGHTQLVLRRARDVLDAVAFRRPDLAAALKEGDRIDVVARVASRRFGGFESIQLEVLDVDAGGRNAAVDRASAVPGSLAARGPSPA